MTFVAELNTFVKKQSTQEIHSLHQFFAQGWPYMGEGGTFIDSWHLHHLSEILEAVDHKTFFKVHLCVSFR